MDFREHFPRCPARVQLRFLGLIFLISGCTDRPLIIDAYAPCIESDECAGEAVCANSGSVNVCRPKCEMDADCPGVEGSAASCGLDGYAVGQCVIPGLNGCPDGMALVSVSAEPESPVVCAWEW